MRRVLISDEEEDNIVLVHFRSGMSAERHL